MAENTTQTYKAGNEVRPRAQGNNTETEQKKTPENQVGNISSTRQTTRVQQKKQEQIKLRDQREEQEEKLSGFGFTMIMGVAIIKDLLDVAAGIIGGAILSFGSSIVAGFALFQYFGDSWFAGATTAFILQLLKFTGIGTAAIGAVNMGLFFAFAFGVFIFGLFLQFVIFTYLSFQGVFGFERGLARRLFIVVGMFIISILPIINWLPETTGTLFVLKRFEKNSAKEKEEVDIKQKKDTQKVTPAALPA